MVGENFVILIGKVNRGNLKQVGQNNINLFKGSMAIPTPRGFNQYIKVSGWGEIAESLGALEEHVFIKAHGHIEESNYEGKCRHCNGPEKKYWTEVVIDNFVVYEGGE